eukprot:12775163-Alexandrium_andersonii.AAC.1
MFFKGQFVVEDWSETSAAVDSFHFALEIERDVPGGLVSVGFISFVNCEVPALVPIESHPPFHAPVRHLV